MAQPKYAARFENFFPNLRLNRAEFADMAEFTLNALRTSGKYAALAEALEAELQQYRTAHAGQLSGEGQATTLTAKQALTDFKAYLKMVERKYIIPTYDEGSADFKALLPNGRSGLAKTAQNKVEDAFTAFLDAMDARPVAFPEALRQQGRGTKDQPGILGNLRATLTAADQAKNASGARKIDLHDGRKATCVVLFKVYATLLVEFFDNPAKAAPFFDLSKAGRSDGGPKPPKNTQPKA
ncbi:hypothetical protein Q5H93_16600 [Hymenobacter sp. ASUV-10]|uniref:Uncharacterized protein n=1 Tax=Hymenobacter aranciens TaxID=3063996 RepID=A0ABT9BDM6_9BACT|nr:hypothetical protein [Hymenobacter sp. ASUV-10]MDO7876366.1 hypothetical protein [Hymenobacter sp. ASUV-10]